MATKNVPPLRATPVAFTTTHTAFAPTWRTSGAGYLVLWSCSVAGAQLYLSTLASDGSDAVDDERPLPTTYPQQVYVGHYDKVSIRCGTEGGTTCVVEFTPSAVVPVREPKGCER